MKLQYIQTTCPYCGTGCSMNLSVVDGKVAGTQPFQRSPVNKGRLCAKGGFCEEFINSPDRVSFPMIRKDGDLQQVSWDEAFIYVADQLKGYTPDDIACVASARSSNEDIWASLKLASEVIQTKNIENTQNLCNIYAGAGIAPSIGYNGSTGSIDAIPAAKVVFLMGVDLYNQNPVLISQIIAAKKNGAQIIVADSKKTATCDLASDVLIYNEGTETSLIAAIIKAVVVSGKHEKSAEKVPGFEAYKNYLSTVSAETTGISDEQVEKVSTALTESSPGALIYSATVFSEAAASSFGALAILTGNVEGIYTLRDRNNGQGATDLRAVCTDGKSLEEILNGGVKALIMAGDSPVLCGCQKVADLLSNLEFFILIDSITTNQTNAAHVLLPAASFAESDGSQTNTERRVQRIRKAVDAPGEAKPVWEIISGMAEKMGTSFGWSSPEEIFTEITEKIPAYKGITWDQISLPEAPITSETIKSAFIVPKEA